MRSLPPFPWDRLSPYSERARAHPDGLVDLSVGAPVDPVPDVAREALTAAADTPGYPATAGTPQLREAITAWVRKHCEASGDFGVLPTIGSKEAIAGLPSMLEIGRTGVVAIPKLAYPTYEIGAKLADRKCVRVDDPAFSSQQMLQLLWINYPSNPTGEVMGAPQLRRIVNWARSRGVTVLSDECYLTLGWERTPVSVLHPDVCGPEPTGVLALHSLSKRSNLAGYRAGFLAGDPELVQRVLSIRKHSGLIPPAPVQHAMAAALSDEQHATAQKERYGARRERLKSALTEAGFRIDHSEAGLYLWATREEDCWDTMDLLARHGILAAPGEFYGPAGRQHVRLALTAVDERVDAACRRLAELS